MERIATIDSNQTKQPWIGGFVTFGEGLCASSVIPVVLGIISYGSGFANAFKRDGTNKIHVSGYANRYYNQPSGTEAQRLGYYIGRTVSKGTIFGGEGLGYLSGIIPATGVGMVKEGYRAIKKIGEKDNSAKAN